MYPAMLTHIHAADTSIVVSRPAEYTGRFCFGTSDRPMLRVSECREGAPLPVSVSARDTSELGQGSAACMKLAHRLLVRGTTV